MVKHLIWAVAVAAAFVLGYTLGDPSVWREARQVAGTASAVRGVAARGPTPAAAPRTAAPAEPGDAPWLARLDELDRLVRAGDEAAADALQQRLLRTVLDRARDGDVSAARRQLDDYLARNPHDPDAHLLASDLLQMQGRPRDALKPLLDLLAFAGDPAVIDEARQRLELIVSVEETQLGNRSDVGALVRLFEELTLRDPVYDGHRLRLAHWLLQAGRLDEAEAVLAETGTVGADPEAREALLRRLERARSGLPLERRGNTLHVSARLGGEPLTMLVDTGASTTAISRDRIADIGAIPTGERVRVRTAGGVVEAEVHRVRDFSVGGVELDSLDVLVLDGPLPQGVDGLLGMDVIERFGDVPGTGVPLPAR
ncbi:MAG TPA: aspartyl protease family protein [Pseudomonadales bacterium]